MDISRIEAIYKKYKNSFIEHVLSNVERDIFFTKVKNKKVNFLAKRFAAKEAAVKALGTGFNYGIRLCDISVDGYQQSPDLVFYGMAKKYFTKLVPAGKKGYTHLSLSDEKCYAQAFVVLEAI